MCALLQIYMVAGSNRCPTLRAGGLRVDPWTSGSRIVARMADANKSSAAFPPFPGETPEAHEVKEWWRATQPHLTASQHALQNHQMPRELLDYTLATVPDALVSQNAGGTDGITESAAQQRAAMIIQITDANDLKLVKRAAHKSEMLHSFYNAIKVAVEQSAPLLMRSLERSCKQPMPHGHMYDGAEALRILLRSS